MDASLRDSAFYRAFQKYQDVLDILVAHRREDDLSYITQHELGSQLRISQTAVSQALNKLYRFGPCVTPVGKGVYHVLQTDAFRYGPFHYVHLYLEAVQTTPSLWLERFEVQAERFGWSLSDLQMVRSYCQMLFSSTDGNAGSGGEA